MKIVFATTLSKSGSTLIGRCLPIAEKLPQEHDIHVLGLSPTPESPQENITLHSVGNEPFIRTDKGKQRLRGFALLISLLKITINTTVSLYKLNPDIAVIVKPHPHNTLGVYLWSIFHPTAKVILDTDDFELTANVLTSIYQRGIIHAAERLASSMSDQIITASPFLSDHFEQLTSGSKPVTMIATGIDEPSPIPASSIPEDTINLLYIGSISSSSGHQVDLLPDILKNLRADHNVTLTFAGDGDDVSRIKQRLADMHLSQYVSWTGRFSPDDVPEILGKTNIIIDPVDASISNRAKSSYRCLLAAINGIPVITSNVGIRPNLLPQSLHDKFFADPDRVDSYISKINALIDSPITPEEKQELIKHAGEFTWAKLATKYNQVITAS